MIENIESLTIIICTILGTAIATVSLIFSLQKSFREHLDNLLNEHDKNLRIWLDQRIEAYYSPLDEKVKILNSRLKIIEKK
jgi:hypothetical protein